MVDRPHRRHVITIALEADSLEEAAGVLRALAYDCATGRVGGSIVSGGGGSGLVLTHVVDESVTHDSYFAALGVYVRGGDDGE